MKNLPIFVILVLLLSVRLFFYFEDEKVYKESEAVELIHAFNHEPKKSSFGQYFFVDNIMVSIPSFPVYEYGDQVKIKGIVKVYKNDKGEMLMVSDPEVKKLDDSASFLAVAKHVRQKIEDSVLAAMPVREGSLLLGILLGVRDKIEKGYYEDLKNAGVLHVIAASGQNVSIVAALLLLLFERILKRRLALVFTVLGVAFYALLTGFDPPIVRASIMAVFAFGALAFGRQNYSIHILFLTAFLMIFTNPKLITDVSFALSFLSTWGIISLKPILDRVRLLDKVRIVKEDITTTLSAQVATLPLIISVFSSYSWVSFFVNTIVLWTVPFIMIFGGIGAILSLILPILGLPFYLLTFPFLRFFGFVVAFSSQFSLVSRFEAIPLAFIIGYYLILASILLKFGKKEINA
mgnify:CR=1 FL=1